MRIIIATYVGLLALCFISAQAAPSSPTNVGPAGAAISPAFELVAQGCGYGYKRTRWQDEWGQWYWGRCVPKTWGNLSRHQFSQ
jgi:hypothetical protein